MAPHIIQAQAIAIDSKQVRATLHRMFIFQTFLENCCLMQLYAGCRGISRVTVDQVTGVEEIYNKFGVRCGLRDGVDR